MSANIEKFAATHDVTIWWEQESTRHMITRLDSGSPIQTWQQAGIGFEIVTGPNGELPTVFTRAGSQDFKPQTDYRALLRDDTLAALGIVSKSYKLHTVADFCDAAKRVEDKSGYRMKTCGTLAGGKKIFFMLETEKEKSIAGEVMNRNVLIGTSFDGKQSSFSICTDVMVVCQNTLSAALNSGSNRFTLTHKQAFSEDHLIGSLEALGEQQARNDEIIMRLVNSRVTDNQIVGYFDNVTSLLNQPSKVKGSKDPETKERWKQEQITAMLDSYLNGPGGINDRDRVESRVGTLHGATQAVYHFVDHKLLKTQSGAYKANYNQRRLGLPGYTSENAIKSGALDMALNIPPYFAEVA